MGAGKKAFGAFMLLTVFLTSSGWGGQTAFGITIPATRKLAALLTQGKVSSQVPGGPFPQPTLVVRWHQEPPTVQLFSPQGQRLPRPAGNNHFLGEKDAYVVVNF